MSRIRGKDTEPERLVRSALHRMGYRFRLHVKDLPGKPDIVLPKFKTVVFVHGCFWHRHPRCKYAYTPKSRVAFWTRKLADNVVRDTTTRSRLQSLGWRVAVIWECQVDDESKIMRLAGRRTATVDVIGKRPYNQGPTGKERCHGRGCNG
jgi:DNA mismatch endonuclease (patch repair protein)